MNELQEALLHHLTHEREPMPIDRLCEELERTGRVSEHVPHAEVWEWRRVVDGLVDQDLLARVSESVVIDHDAVKTKEAIENGSLF